ncbi:MAG: hypothetical protein Q9192_005737 [Flavoplaca navasiana]
MLISLTVGKVDAGVAVLLTEDKRLRLPLRNPFNPSNHPSSPPTASNHLTRPSFAVEMRRKLQLSSSGIQLPSRRPNYEVSACTAMTAKPATFQNQRK